MATEDVYVDEDGNPVSADELSNYDVVDVREFEPGSTWDAIKSIPLRAAARGSDVVSGGLQALGDLFGSETLTGLAEKGRQNTRNFESYLDTATNFTPGGGNELASQIGGKVLSTIPAFMAGGPVGASLAIGGMSGADKYGQLREQEVDPLSAAGYASMAGAKDAALAVPMMNPIFRSGMGTLGKATLGAAYGAPTGALGGALDEGINQVALEQESDLERIKGAAKFGGLTGAATGAAFGAISPSARTSQASQVDDLATKMAALEKPVVDVEASVASKTIPDAPIAPKAEEASAPPITEQSNKPVVEQAKQEVGVIEATKQLLSSDPEGGFFTPGDLIEGGKGLVNKIKSKVQTGSDIPKILDEMGLTATGKPGQDVSPIMSEGEKLLDSKTLGVIREKAIFQSTLAKKSPEFKPVYDAGNEIYAHVYRTADRLNEPLKPYMELDDVRRSKVDAFNEANRRRAFEGKPVFNKPEEMRVLGFDDGQIAAHQGLRKSMDDALDIYGGALKNRLANLPDGDGKLKAFAEIDALVRNLKDKHYVPFGRFGNKFLRVFDDANNTEAYFMFENDSQAKAYKKELIGRGRKVEEGRLRAPKNEEFSGIPFNLLLDVSEKLRTVDPNLHAEFDKIIGEMVDLKSKQAKPQSGFGTHFRKAELVPGYSKDFRRVIADYAVGLSHFDAYSKWAPEMNAAVAKMGDNTAVKQYAQKYVDGLRKPDPETVQAIQRVSAAYLLSRPASAATNLTQSFLTTLPEIFNQLGKAGKGGTLLSSRILTNSGAKAARYLKGGEISNPSLKAALNDEIKSGLLSEQAYRELSRTARGSSGADLTDKLTYLFRKAEVFNRTTAYISGWEVGTRKGLEGEALKQFAKEFVNTTQFNQTKANRPLMARGWAAPAFTFRLFSGHYLRFLRDGLDDGNWRRLAASPLAGLLLGGVAALPGAKEIFKTAENFGLDPRGELKKAGKNGTLEALAYGGVPHVLGIANLTGSLGTGDILPDLYNNPVSGIANAVVGVPFSLVGRAGKAYDQFEKGYPLRGAGQLLPEMFRGPLEAIDAASRGKVISGDGTVLLDDPTPYELGLRSVGVMPPRLADAYVDNRSQYLIQRRAEQERGNYNWQIAKAMVDGGDVSALYREAYRKGQKPNMAQIRSYVNKMSSKAGAQAEFVKKLPKTKRAEAIKRLQD